MQVLAQFGEGAKRGKRRCRWARALKAVVWLGVSAKINGAVEDSARREAPRH
jgi:hypothetical protein